MDWSYPNEDRHYWNERKKNETQGKPLKLTDLPQESGSIWTENTSSKISLIILTQGSCNKKLEGLFIFYVNHTKKDKLSTLLSFKLNA